MVFQNWEKENIYTCFSAGFQCPHDKRHMKPTCRVSFTFIRWRETKLGDSKLGSLKIQLMSDSTSLLKRISLLYSAFLRPDYIISQERLPKILYLITYYFSNSFLQQNKLSASYVNASWLLMLSVMWYLTKIKKARYAFEHKM